VGTPKMAENLLIQLNLDPRALQELPVKNLTAIRSSVLDFL